MGLGPAVQPLARADEGAAAEILALAFHDQPLDRAVVGGSRQRRLRAERAGMRGTLEAARGRADVRVARVARVARVGVEVDEGPGAGLVGVLVALPPWVHPLAPPGVAAQLRALLAQGFRTADRWRRVFEALAARHPPEPVWYLSLLGVAPEHQGRGIGSALLDDWLADVDVAAEPAWLETARAENLPLYRRNGFAVVEEIELHGVPVWLMGRPARLDP